MYKTFSALVDGDIFFLRSSRSDPDGSDDSAELTHVMGQDRASTGFERRGWTKDNSADWWWGLPSI